MKRTYTRIYLSYTLFFLFNFCLFSQQSASINSLLSALKIAKTDSTRLNILNQLSGECNEGDILKYAMPALQLAEKLNSKYIIAYSSSNIAYYYKNRGDISNSLKWYYKALKNFEKNNNKKETANTISSIGLIYKDIGDVQKALDMYYIGLKMQEDVNDKEGIAYSLNNIAQVFKKQDNIVKALELYTKSLKIHRDINDKIGEANVLINIGNLNLNLSSSSNSIIKKEEYYNYALLNFKKSLKQYEEFNDKEGITYAQNNIGLVYFKKATINNTEKDINLKEALKWYNYSLNINEEIKNNNGISSSLKSIGSVYLLQKNYKQAEEYTKRAIETAKQIGYPDKIRNASEQLSQIYKATGKYKEALEMFELFKLMSDSVNTLEIHESSIKKELQYDFEKKENATKAEQEKKDIITKRELQKQKIVRNSFIVGFLFLFILVLLIYRWYKQKQKANIKIAAQKQEVENQKHIVEEKQKEILDSILYAKRIQNAILPNENYIQKKIKELKK